MNISLATNQVQIAKCFPVIIQLRPTLLQKDFLDQVTKQKKWGYKLVCLECRGKVVSVAGFRITENIVAHKTLYVSDFVTDKQSRCKGYGSKLFTWLFTYAKKEKCQSLQLDSGLERFGSHQFYTKNNMTIFSYRFILPLE